MKKHRDKTGEYLIEGWNLIHEAAAENCEIKYVVLSEDTQTEKTAREIMNAFSDRLAAEDVAGTKSTLTPDNFVFMKGSLYNKVALTETSQGILAVVKKNIPDREKFIEEACRDGTNIVVLDRLQDPGNIGTIIRTADAAGYAGILAIKGTGDVYSPKVARAAAGSLFRVPVLYVDDVQETLEIADAASKTVLVTCFEDAVDYREVDMRGDIALVIGNEGNGVSQEFLRAAGKRVKIPMKAPVDSLNAAVAAGVLMYHSLE